jgi:hypothetical protein
MSAMPVTFLTDPAFLRHDLMVEIARIDMALDEVRTRDAANQPEMIQSLEKRRATLNDALTRLVL